jgi:hypothetical protein
MAANDVRARAYDCLAKAEKELRDLLIKAVQDGDYNATSDLNQAAQDVARVARPLAGTKGAERGAGVYPKYYRLGQRLVLTGKSKKRPNELYQHKAPKEVLDKLVAALLRSKEPITPTEVLVTELHDYPAYQPTTCLRWMKDLGLVKRYGHKGYKVLAPDQFEVSVATHWERLPAL